MGQYQDISIRDLVEEINEKYFLPDIQREFVWNTDKNKFEDKICDLFDSIMRGYPIGTLLFWEVDEKRIKEDNISVLEFIKNSNGTNDVIPTSNFSKKNLTLVLDGQQRMTILNLAFKGIFEEKYYGKKKKKYLYFNLLSKDEESKEINERRYEFKLIESEENYFKDKEGKIWHKVPSLLQQPDSVAGYRKEIYKSMDVIDEISQEIIEDNLSRFWRIITEKNLSYYEIGKEKKDEEALEIFVRVNSGGMTLTYSDLLFSKIKQYWKEDKKIDAREEFKEFLEDINGNDFEFDNNFILKTSLVLINKDIRYQVKNFNRDNVKLIKDNWENIKENIKSTVEFLRHPEVNINSKKMLRSSNALIPIIYYLHHNSIKEIDKSSIDFDILKRYIYSVLLNGAFGGQSDSMLLDSRKVISSTKTKEFPIKELFKAFGKRNKVIRTGEELNDLLKDVKYGTDKSKLILNIAYDFRLPKEFQEDHLFSRTKLLKNFDRNEVNNVANIQPLGSFTNNSKNDKKFEDWIKEKNRSIDYAKLNLIPSMGNYNEDHFKEFLEKRRELILEKIKGFFE